MLLNCKILYYIIHFCLVFFYDFEEISARHQNPFSASVSQWYSLEWKKSTTYRILFSKRTSPSEVCGMRNIVAITWWNLALFGFCHQLIVSWTVDASHLRACGFFFGRSTKVSRSYSFTAATRIAEYKVLSARIDKRLDLSITVHQNYSNNIFFYESRPYLLISRNMPFISPPNRAAGNNGSRGEKLRTIQRTRLPIEKIEDTPIRSRFSYSY